jgi:hypothetical protein
MGEKGLAAAAGGVVGASTSFASDVSDTAITTATGAGESLKDKLIDTGLDHAIDEGRKRLRKSGEPESESE